MTRDPAQVFSRSLDIVFGLEGGYADHPADKGGRTIYGISERAYPELWKSGPPSKDQAAEAYKALWRDSGAERIAGLQAPGADRLATALFDAAVHHGPQRAAILLQRAAGAGIKQDGTLGPKTLEQIEARLRHDTRGKSVIADLAKERTRFFNRIVQRDPSQRTFLAGWNERLVRLHDGFGGRGPNWTVDAPKQERSLEAMGACHFQGYFKSASGRVYDAWLCTSGAIVLWPTACTDDPSNPCKES
jgi:lysozyme family protein